MDGRQAPSAGDRGAGTVLVLALVAVALVLLAATGAVGAAAVAGTRAASAADLAALAGADVLLGRTPGDPCAAAGATATANRARLSACAITSTDLGGVQVPTAVAVEVALDAPSAALGPVARARARAGLAPVGDGVPGGTPARRAAADHPASTVPHPHFAAGVRVQSLSEPRSGRRVWRRRGWEDRGMSRTAAVVAPRPPSLDLRDLSAADDSEDLVPGGLVEGLELEGADLSGRRLVDLDVRESRWHDVALEGADLRGARFTGCELSSLGAATLAAPLSRWRDGEIAGSRLGTADLHGAEVERLVVRGCRLGFVNLRGARISDLSFEDCVVDELDLTDATVARLASTGCRLDVVDVGVTSAKHLDLRGSGVATLNGVRSLDGVVLDEDQARWFAPLLAATLGARVL